jgi:hypothetical protein
MDVIDPIISFFSTPKGAALSSIVTISSFIYALFQRSSAIKISKQIIIKDKKIINLETQNTNLSQEITLISKSNNELKIINTDLSKTVNNLESGDLNNSKQSVRQTGKNNINNGDIDGDVTLNLS